MALDLAQICLEGLSLARQSIENLGEEGRVALHKAGEPLTKSDLAISTVLKKYFLQSNLPAVYCSEEAGQINFPSNPRYRIYCDELDGTFNFLRGGILPYSCVISAFEEKKNISFRDAVFAGVLDLRTGDLWYAIKGEGCFFNSKKVITSGKKDLGSETFVMIDHGPCPLIEDLRKFEKVYSSIWPHNVSSAGFHLAGVASGHFDAYVSNVQKAHELGAGSLLIREANGEMISLDTGDLIDEQIFDFNAKYPVIAAATRELANKLKDKIMFKT